MQDSFKKSAAFDLDGGELRFEPVAQGHQFFDFGDDAVLFVEGRKGDYHALQVRCTDSPVANSSSAKSFDAHSNNGGLGEASH